MEKFKKLICGLLLIGLILPNITPAYGATPPDENENCVVTSVEASDFIITIPKTLVVTDECSVQGCTKRYSHAHYDVQVAGDISVGGSISVVPDTNFNMSCAGRSDEVMEVSQSKTNWNSSDCENKVKASGLIKSLTESKFKAGVWSGAFTFRIVKTEPVPEATPTARPTATPTTKPAVTPKPVDSDLDKSAPGYYYKATIFVPWDVLVSVGAITTNGITLYAVQSMSYTPTDVTPGTPTPTPKLGDLIFGGGEISQAQAQGIQDQGAAQAQGVIGGGKLPTGGALPTGGLVITTRTPTPTPTQPAGQKSITLFDGGDLILPNTINTIEESAFNNAPDIERVVGSGVRGVKSSAFKSCGRLYFVRFDNLFIVETWAFQNCERLEAVDMPNLVDVGGSAFAGCSSLHSIDLSNVTHIGNGAFYRCTSLTTVDLPKLASGIPLDAFYDCSSLTYLSAPMTTSVGVNACAGCPNLTYIDISNADTIGTGAFINCTAIETLKTKKKVTIAEGAFPD